MTQMMKHCITFLLLFVSLATTAQKPKKSTEYHYKKLKSAEGLLLDGKREGVWTFWNAYGEVKATIEYHAGIEEGTCTLYRTNFPDDNLVKTNPAAYYKQVLKWQQQPDYPTPVKSTGAKHKGLKNGSWKHYSNNILESEENYVNDTLHGTQRTYSHDGRLQREETYNRGILEGPYKDYAYNGLLKTAGQYANNARTGQWKEYREADLYVYSYKNGAYDGLFQHYDRNDSLVEQYTYKDGKKHGPFLIRSYEGFKRISQTGHFVNDQEEGWTRKYSDGQLVLEVQSKQGKYHGRYTSYDTKGNITEKGIYRDNLRDSTWIITGNELGRCTAEYKTGLLTAQVCRDEKGRKTGTEQYDENRVMTRTQWWTESIKKREEVNNGQTTITTEWDAKGKLLKTDTVVEAPKEFALPDEAHFPGGEAKLYAFINANIRYPAIAREMGIQGKVIAEFKVKTDGSITDITIKKSVHHSLDQEVIRMIKQMPRWEPGKFMGHEINSLVSLPVDFVLK